MGKKVREYKSGDFIFAKVKGYPAWPARVQKMNGKKYFVYFYGTGETANLPPNMIFDYAENKDKFLTKTVKRRDFNDGVKQIEHDFANNVSLEEVIGGSAEAVPETANDSANDTANETMDDSTAADTTAADETMANESTANASASNDTGVEDSDEAGALVIDEGKKGKKSKPETAKPAAKETPAKPAKEAKTPRGKAKKEDAKEPEEEEKEKEEQLVSRSGRKIRPKRYIDEQTEENATLPSPVPKKRRAASPAGEKESKDKTETKDKAGEKNAKLYSAVTQSELEDLKEPFKQEDPEKDNILIAYLPTNQYVGIKLFQSRPTSFKNEAARLQWDKQAASNAVTLKLQLERGQITPQSILAQLVMDLNLTDEEKSALDKERETEEKKSRVQFLKTEMKLIELDAKIKTCLCLEKADTELCLKLLDELMELEVRPLMLLKHPTCLETVKRMRAYVGNTPSWDLSESAALLFSKQAHRIRKQADTLYKSMKDLFITPEGLSFWEFFSDRVLQFKKATSKLNADELLELVHEPLDMTMPSSHTMKAAVDAANDEEPPEAEEEEPQKKKTAAAKPKKNSTSTPSKPNLKRQSSRKQQQEDKEKESKTDSEESPEEQNKETDKNETPVEKENDIAENEEAESTNKDTDSKEAEPSSKETNKSKDKEPKNKEKDPKNKEKESKSKEKKSDVKEIQEVEEMETEEGEKEKNSEETEVDKEKSPSPSEKEKASETKEDGKEEKAGEKEDKDKEIAEPRAKRSRETKKTEPPPPRSPAKRKSKF